MSGERANRGERPGAEGEPPASAGSEGNLVWLYAGRALRSCSTAFLGIVFPLYLAARGESSTAVGVVLTASAAVSALLILAVGLVGDRFGRRRVLIALGLLGAAGGVVLALFSNPVLLVLASGLAGVGRGGGAGGGGAFGPFFPAEQPLLAASVRPDRRTAAFGRIGFVGVLTGALGSLVALVPGQLHGAGWSILAADRLLFVVGAAVSLWVVVVSLPIREPPPPGRPQRSRATRDPSTLTTRQLIGRLGLTNALNGFGFGFLGPLLTYWFHTRFGAGAAAVGALYTVANLLSALPYLGAHRLTRRLGAVRTVVATRSASVVALLAMAAAPSFLVAAALLSVRTMFNSLGLPARQSYTMGVADERRRGTVAALGALPSMFTSSVSPVVGGALMGLFVDVPIVGAALFMGANTLTYYLAFRHAPLPEERASRAPSPG